MRVVEFAVELADRAGQCCAAAEQVAGDPHLRRLFAAGELAAEPVEPDRTVERAKRHRECRVELVQVPAQPLLAAAPLGDQVVAVVDQQLQLPQRLLAGTRPVSPAPAAQLGRPRARRSGPTCRAPGRGAAAAPSTVAAPAPAARPPRPAPLQTARDVTAVLSAHSRSLTERRAQPSDTARRPARSSRAAGRARRPQLPSASACARPLRSRSFVSPPTDMGATGERTGLTRGELPSSYQVTLGGLGKAAATQHWQVSPRATFGNRVSRRQPESLLHSRRHPPENDSEFGNVP